MNKGDRSDLLPVSFLTSCSAGIGSAFWEKLVYSGAKEFGIDATPHQMAQLTLFARILCEWNQKINLTAITDPEEVAIKHFIDSMAALPYLQKTENLLDIGSGGGFPGLVLAVFRPDLQIISVDAVRKKISFQQHIIRTLGLSRVHAVHARVESLAAAGRSLLPRNYDVIVSRALGSVGLFIDLSLPLLAPEGTIIAYKGAARGDSRDEIEACKTAHPSLIIDIRAYRLPKYGDRRTLVFAKPS